LLWAQWRRASSLPRKNSSINCLRSRKWS